VSDLSYRQVSVTDREVLGGKKAKKHPAEPAGATERKTCENLGVFLDKIHDQEGFEYEPVDCSARPRRTRSNLER